jgi:peptidylprolyl isomerase
LKSIGMPFEKGSLILVDYTATVKDTGEVIDTTREEDAKKHNIYEHDRLYEPRLVAVGEGWVLKGFDEALINANVNEDVTVDVPPEKAFGSRDPNKVRLIPLRKLGDKADEAKVGDVIEMDNRVGIIRSISSGRVQIDFNHRLAGKTITYSFKVVKVLDDDRERVVALIRRRMPVKQDKLNVVINNDGMLEVFIPEEYYMQEGLQIIKRGIANDIFKYVKSIKSIRFIEVYERKEEVKESKVEEKRAEVVEGVKQEEQAQASASTGNT